MSSRCTDRVYCKPSVIAVLGRVLLYVYAATTPPPTDVPVRSKVWRARWEGDEALGGIEDNSGATPRLLYGRLSAERCELRKASSIDKSIMGTILHGAHARVVRCSRHGFRKAEVQIEMDDSSVRLFRIGNLDLEVMAKCLEFVPASGPSGRAPE
ncbi:MAG: hypothetical protein ABI382_11195 [Nakamurella sp.]